MKAIASRSISPFPLRKRVCNFSTIAFSLQPASSSISRTTAAAAGLSVKTFSERVSNSTAPNFSSRNLVNLASFKILHLGVGAAPPDFHVAAGSVRRLSGTLLPLHGGYEHAQSRRLDGLKEDVCTIPHRQNPAAKLVRWYSLDLTRAARAIGLDDRWAAIQFNRPGAACGRHPGGSRCKSCRSSAMIDARLLLPGVASRRPWPPVYGSCGTRRNRLP
jgi:hypothetical protein